MGPGRLGTAAGLTSMVEGQGQKAGNGGYNAPTPPLSIDGNMTRDGQA